MRGTNPMTRNGTDQGPDDTTERRSSQAGSTECATKADDPAARGKMYAGQATVIDDECPMSARATVHHARYVVVAWTGVSHRGRRRLIFSD